MATNNNRLTTVIGAAARPDLAYLFGKGTSPAAPDNTITWKIAEEDIIPSSVYATNDVEHPEFVIKFVDAPTTIVNATTQVNGMLIVVDITKGLTDSTLSLAKDFLKKKSGIRPMLFLDKLDVLVAEHMPSLEQVYQRCVSILDSVNDPLLEIIAASDKDEAWISNLSPSKGNVAFGNLAAGWGFTLRDFSRHHTGSFFMLPDEIMTYLWGDYFLIDDFAKKNLDVAPWAFGAFKMSKEKLKGRGNPDYDRLFVFMCLRTIADFFRISREYSKDEISGYFAEVSSALKHKPNEQDYDLQGKERADALLRQIFPLHRAVLDMVALHVQAPGGSAA